MNWAKRRQTEILIVLVLAVLIPLLFISLKKPASSCTDNIQNGEETGVDCGGPTCRKCLGEVKPLIIRWTKAFTVDKGRYEVGAFIENPNAFAGIPSLAYSIKLYDSAGVLVSVRENKTFVNSGEKFVIFESNISTGERLASRAEIEMDKNPIWQRVEKEKPNLTITRKDYSESPTPRFAIDIQNKSLYGVKDVVVSGIIYDTSNIPVGISATLIPSIASGETSSVVLTWGKNFAASSTRQDIITRVGSF